MKRGSRVRLLPRFDGVYLRAVGGSEGWVRDVEDRDGFERIFIEWDKDFWNYQGEADVWTYANHFEVISVPDEEEFTSAPQQAPCPECGGYHDDPKADEAAYDATLDQGLEDARKADGFLLIAVSEQEILGTRVQMPRVYRATLTEEASLMIDGQLSHLASMAHMELVEMMLNDLAGPDEEVDDDGREATDGSEEGHE